MDLRAKNGTTEISMNHFYPRSINVNTHLCGHEVKVNSSHWPARDVDHKDGKRDAYISFSIEAQEKSFEVPNGETDRSTDQTVYMDIEQVRALRDKLSEALDCADIK